MMWSTKMKWRLPSQHLKKCLKHQLQNPKRLKLKRPKQQMRQIKKTTQLPTVSQKRTRQLQILMKRQMLLLMTKLCQLLTCQPSQIWWLNLVTMLMMKSKRSFSRNLKKSWPTCRKNMPAGKRTRLNTTMN